MLRNFVLKWKKCMGLLQKLVKKSVIIVENLVVVGVGSN